MRLLICIDDTDNLNSKGTGAIADELRVLIKFTFGRDCGFVTRHQLLIHEDVPYTSHNSSMCFPCEIEAEQYDRLTALCFEHLKKESAEGSDPGLAVAVLGEADEAALIAFGKDAKRRILSKNDAYTLAKEANVYLKEAGGTGDGVIGALAGIGLRLWGNDGTLKGQLPQFEEGRTYSVKDFTDTGIISSVQDEKGNPLSPDEQVLVGWKAKPSMINGLLTLLVKKSGGKWSVMEKQEMRDFSGNKVYAEGCGSFIPDVLEELVSNAERSCFNCRYRRWMENGLLCQYNKK